MHALPMRIFYVPIDTYMHCTHLFAGDATTAERLRRRASRPRTADMIEDFAVLEAELQRLYGKQRVLPGRTALTEEGRVDVYRAIVAHGGSNMVAARMGWALPWRPRKPRGYWDSRVNVRREMMDFIAEQGLFPGALPKKMALRRAGRSDLEKAVERWGGVARLASELGLEPPSEALQQRWSQFLNDLQEVTGRQGDDVRIV